MASEPIHSLDVSAGVAMFRFWEKEKRTMWEKVVSVSVAIVFHAFLFGTLYLLPKKQNVEKGGMASSVKVRVAEKSDSLMGKPPTSHLPSPTLPKAQKRANVSKSTTAPRIPVLQDNTVTELPKESQHQEDDVAVSESALTRFLPSSQSEFAENQRRLGAQGSADAESSEEVLPQKEMRTLRPNVVTTEFSTLAYRLELERRFSDAWGGVRILPPYSRFSGRTGELIVYNVVINRDGTLRRIVNLSALEQSERDFSAVDGLVQDFAESVFPMNPIPARIREEPFVVRWSIRFMGFQYSFF
jgi:hypothetical protein